MGQNIWTPAALMISYKHCWSLSCWCDLHVTSTSTRPLRFVLSQPSSKVLGWKVLGGCKPLLGSLYLQNQTRLIKFDWSWRGKPENHPRSKLHDSHPVEADGSNHWLTCTAPLPPSCCSFWPCFCSALLVKHWYHTEVELCSPGHGNISGPDTRYWH